MTEYVAKCSSGVRDTITARVDGSSIELKAAHEGGRKLEIYLYEDDARTFARGILALADELDGEEVAEAAPKRAVKVGDRVRITRNHVMDGDENLGTVGQLSRIDAGDLVYPYLVELPDGIEWWCVKVELVDAPEPAPVDAPSSAFAGLVTQAKQLLEGTAHNGADIITLAREMADRV
jgi:hypothetical protein